MLRNEVVLVDEKDREIGVASKKEAHRRPLLHRAFSVFLYHDQMMLIQRRALNKYHSGGLWANTCCSHPAPDEQVLSGGESRLMEEAGISAKLQPAFTFIYRHQFEDNLYEHEFDHVLLGTYSGDADPNPEEIAEMKWVSFDEILRGLAINPKHYAPWFQIAAPKVIEMLRG